MILKDQITLNYFPKFMQTCAVLMTKAGVIWYYYITFLYGVTFAHHDSFQSILFILCSAQVGTCGVWKNAQED